jgi:putative transposase
MGYHVHSWKVRNFSRRYMMTRQFKRLAHSIYECKYHVVFCPKYRYRILRDEVAEYTKQQVYRLCQQKDKVEVLELSIQPDHVHLVVSIPPKYAVSSFMGYLKGKLAIRLFDRYEKLGRRYWGRHLWSRGYCVSTIGLDEEQIRKYVNWQEKREKQLEAIQGKLFD